MVLKYAKYAIIGMLIMNRKSNFISQIVDGNITLKIMRLYRYFYLCQMWQVNEELYYIVSKLFFLVLCFEILILPVLDPMFSNEYEVKYFLW